jgi:hypothetical protein
MRRSVWITEPVLQRFSLDRAVWLKDLILGSHLFGFETVARCHFPQPSIGVRKTSLCGPYQDYH